MTGVVLQRTIKITSVLAILTQPQPPGAREIVSGVLSWMLIKPDLGLKMALIARFFVR